MLHSAAISAVAAFPQPKLLQKTAFSVRSYGIRAESTAFCGDFGQLLAQAELTPVILSTFLLD